MIFSRAWDWDSLETLSIPTAELRTYLERLLGEDPDERTRAGLEDRSVDVTDYCRNEILAVLPRLLSHADGADPEYFHEICHLVPQLADSSAEVIGFLRKSVSTLEGELRQAAADALEEAEEAAREGHMQ